MCVAAQLERFFEFSASDGRETEIPPLAHDDEVASCGAVEAARTVMVSKVWGKGRCRENGVRVDARTCVCLLSE